MRWIRAGGSLVLCALATACGAGPDDAPGSIDSLPQLSAVVEARIGSVDDPGVGFSRLIAADIDRDGNVYALEALDHEIRVYDPDGNLVRRIGRRGGGPGEFESPPRFGVNGDTLWTYDNGAGRITLFDRTGTVLVTGPTRGFRVPARTGWGYLTPVSMRSDGLLVGWFTRISYSRNDQPADVGTDTRVPRVVFDASGVAVDTIGWLPAPPPRMVPPEDHARGRWQRITVGSESYSVPDPPTELPEWMPLDDGYIVVDVPYTTSPESGTFTVTRIDNAGDTLFHRILRYRPQPYTDALLDSAAGQQPRAFMDGVEVTKQVDAPTRNAIRAQMDFPDYRLPVRYSWLANDDAVWLRRRDEQAGLARWVLLTPDGEVRGELELPAGSRPLWSRSETLWAAVPDEFDVPWLVRYRITE